MGENAENVGGKGNDEFGAWGGTLSVVHSPTNLGTEGPFPSNRENLRVIHRSNLYAKIGFMSSVQYVS